MEIIEFSDIPEFLGSFERLSFDIASTENGPLILLLKRDFVSSSIMNVFVELY